MPSDSAPALQRVQTGLEGLDQIVRGGFPANRLYLIHGNPGTGKTTLALQFLIEGARLGERVLYVTLSETKDELTDVAESHGLSLEGIDVYDLALPQGTAPAEPPAYTLFHPSQIELADITNAICAEIERINPRRVVFDSLSEMRLLAGDALRYRRQILALKQFFHGRSCTVFLLDDNTSSDSDRQLESLAHGVVLLEQQFPKFGVPRRQLRVLKLRGVNFVGGYHDFEIRTSGLLVYPRLISADHPKTPASHNMSSGIKELDDLTGGALDSGTSVLVMGPAGTGKSTIAAQYASFAAEQGKTVVYFIFEESRATLLKRTRGLGMDFEKHIEDDRCRVHQIDPGEMSPGAFSVLVRKAVEKDGARVVVIDSLNGYQQAMPGEDFLALHMHELLGYLRQQGVLTFLIMAQSGMLGTMTSPVDISYLADTVLLLRYFEAEGQIRKAISVVKRRTGGHEDTIREFTLGVGGLRVGKPLRQFRGVLTGVPVYTGEPKAMMGAGHDESKS